MYDRIGRRSGQTGGGSKISGLERTPGKTTLTSALPVQREASTTAVLSAKSDGAASETAAERGAPQSEAAPNISAVPEADSSTSGSTAPETGSTSAGHTAHASGQEGAQRTPVNAGEGESGSIGTITGPGLVKSKGDSDAFPSVEAGPSPGGMPVELSMTTTMSSGLGAAIGEGKHDSGDLTASTTFSQPGGRSVSPFGSEFYEPAFSGTTWTLSGGVCKITTTLDINCPWGTASGGRTDIKSGTDGAITKSNWSNVRDDLIPSTSSPYKSPRTKFYSQSLVERHEQFHGTDDEGWTKSSGIPLAQAKAKAATINSSTASADVTNLLTSVLAMLRSENLKWYKGGGSSHDSYAGEIRAYIDGKPEYEKLAKAVEAHGKTLT